MKKIALLCLTILASLTVAIAAETAAPTEMSIITGRESGTYYLIGKDLKKLLAQNNIDLSVIPSRGSMENLINLYEFPSIQLGLAQLDTLTLLALQAAIGGEETAPDLQQLLDKMQLVLPLYAEEVHLVAGEAIKQIGDLSGKRVGIGDSASGTFGTAQVILAELKVEPEEVYAMGETEAIEALRKGEIDAFFYVVGMPAKMLQDQIKAEDKFHLVPLTRKDTESKLLNTLYKETTIPANTYPWQKEAVPTLAVGNAIITADKGDCTAVGKFAKIVYDNLNWLKQNGHPKWKNVEINLDTLLKDPKLSPCVAKALK
ncbi:MAG: TAXI family TRAP transporter solute-binding subunit [Candidatus Competibacteraceae bacterium]